LLDAKVVPLEKFDALLAKITRERQIGDGYFVQGHPEGATVLFVVDGAPYAAGRVAGEQLTSLEIHEFITAYSRRPQSPLSFFVTDKRLLLGLMILFRHRPALQFTTDLVDVAEVLTRLATRGRDGIVGIRSGEEWGLTVCARGKPVANYFPPSGAEALKEPSPAEQLLVYVYGRPNGMAMVDIYEETRVAPAGDASLLAAEGSGRITERYLALAAAVQQVDRESAVPTTAPAPPPAPAPAPEPPLVLESEAPPVPAPVIELAAPEAAPSVAPAPVIEPAPVLGEAPAPVREPVEAPEPVPVPAAAAPAPQAEAPPPAPAPRPGPIPEVTLYLGEKLLRTYSLAKGELTVGRNPDRDILIENAGVSRRHATIRWDGGQALVEDLGSANGTYVNGQKVTRQILQDGDEILVLKHRLLFRLPKGKPAAKLEPMLDAGQTTMFIQPGVVPQVVTAKSEAAAKLRPRLILPDLKKVALSEGEEILLGSGSDCRIQLSGIFVAKAHAKILSDREGQFKIVHLSGVTGTRVNGEKIRERLLKHGDEIEIGKQKLLFRLER
jgi:pSer/pThr/pTyr-binding forkhead associated (FHA) protein